MNTQVKRKPIGVVGITNTYGLAVFEIDHSTDRLLTQYHNGDGYVGKASWNKIEYDRSGRAFFKKKGIKYYLDDVMRV